MPDQRAKLTSNAAPLINRAAPSAAERAERATAKKIITAAASKAPITAIAKAAMRSPSESMTPGYEQDEKACNLQNGRGQYGTDSMPLDEGRREAG